MYCSAQDIIDYKTEKEVAMLTNDTVPSIVDRNVLEKIILDASDYINGFLYGRYSLPLIGSHTIIKKICVDLVYYELYKRRNKLTELIQSLYSEANKTLDKLQRGIITLDEGTPEARPTFILRNDRKPLIDPEVLENY